jgi:hypothetical protein
MGEKLNRPERRRSTAFKLLQSIREGFNFGVERAESGSMAALTQFDGRSPFGKLGQQRRFDLLKLFLNPLPVFVG